MSARDALVAYLRQAGLSTARAEANLDAFAHELAEEQRAALEHGPGASWDYETGRALADLIDPHVGRESLSPASVQLPPGAEDCYPPEVIARLNQGPARPDEEPTT